jgi:hypothetical protein
MLAAVACSSTVNGSSAPDEGLGGQGGEGEPSASGGQSSGGSGGSANATGGSGGSGGGNASGGGTSTGGTDALSCSEGVLDVATPGEFDTRSRDDSFTTSCGAGSSPDTAFTWTAPSTNFYAFDTSGSGFDTVVALLDGACNGDELICSNENSASPQGRVVAKVSKDQQVVVVVDGNLGESGDGVVKVAPVTCPATDLSDQPLPATLSTVEGTNTHEGACGGADTPEKAIRYVAQADDLYRFSVTSDDFSPALYVEQGPECGGQLLQCNTNVQSGYPVEVTRWLTQGEAVTVIVDGGPGTFSLDVQTVPDTSNCQQMPALTSLSDAVINQSTPNLLSSSCAWAGNVLPGDGLNPYPEHAYTFTVDLAVAENCTVSIVGDQDFQAYLLRGDHCEGAEWQCTDMSLSQAFSFTKNDNGVYTLVIENTHTFGSPLTYSISTSC